MRDWNGNGCCVRKSLTNTAVLIFMLESSYPCYPVNRADGISEIEGKAAKGSGEQVGKGASFKSVVDFRKSPFARPFHGSFTGLRRVS